MFPCPFLLCNTTGVSNMLVFYWWAATLLLVCSPIALESHSRASCLCHSQVSCFSPLYDVTLKFIIDFYSMHSASASEYDRQLAPYTDTLHFIFWQYTALENWCFWKLDASWLSPHPFQMQCYCDSLFLCPIFVLYFMVSPKVFH